MKADHLRKLVIKNAQPREKRQDKDSDFSTTKTSDIWVKETQYPHHKYMMNESHA